MKARLLTGVVLFSLMYGGVALAVDRDVCPTCTYTTIQSAINAAANGDRVRVTAGTYSEHLSMNTQSVTLSGGWSADFSTWTRNPALTVVDGGASGRVLSIQWEGDVTVQNITLQNGSYNSGVGGGVGIYTSGDNPLKVAFEDVVVQDCESANHGGGIGIMAYGPIRARLTNVIVRGCAATGSGAGGGMWLGTGSTTPGDLEVFITNSLIYNNQAATREGGGIVVWAQEGASSTRCVILNSTITGNTSGNASIGGGGVVVDDDATTATAVLEMYNSIIYGNTASPGADLTIATSTTNSRADVYNCDINGVNHASGTYNYGENINDDPDFVNITPIDPAAWDLRLQGSSPCIDEGDSNPPSLLLPYTDLDANRRVADGDGDLSANVDMGAYEYDSTAPVPQILHQDGAVWSAASGWNTDTPPYYPGTAYARAFEFNPTGGYGILHRDGAVWISGEGGGEWTLSTPPYYPGTNYAKKAQLLSDGSYSILHTDGAIWNSDEGWNTAAPPYYPGTGYAVDIEYTQWGDYFILHRDGAVYNSEAGWNTATPPYHPGTAYAVDLELKSYGSHYVILHRDGALWSSDTGWNTTTPPYYPGTAYAKALALQGEGYRVLHQDGAIYDSATGWLVTAPPYYPGTAYAVDLEVK
jgi:hypothetical protein